MTSFKSWIIAGALALACPGCIIVDDDDEDLGILTVVWTIDGVADPADCAFYGFDRFELAVYDIFDDPVVTSTSFCEDLELSISLPEGSYSADATLIDRFDRAATTTQLIDAIDIIEDDELVTFVDFPARSFR
jgi:hypothetical protein